MESGCKGPCQFMLILYSIVAVLKVTLFMWFHLVSRDETAPLAWCSVLAFRPSGDRSLSLQAHSVSTTAEQIQTGLQAACAPHPLNQQALRGYPKLPLFAISVSLRRETIMLVDAGNPDPTQVPTLRISCRLAGLGRVRRALRLLISAL